ncbi:MAG: C39 family peptidase [Verrucomicrobiia bacterium]
MKSDLPALLEKSLGVKGRNVTLGKSDWLKTRVLEYSYQEVTLRLLMEENQLINLTLLPQEKASKKWSGDVTIKPEERKQKMLDNVKTLSNGDVIIENIPMFDQGDRGYCAMGSLAMVMQYYGLNLNIDALAAKAGYREGDVQNAALEPVYYAAAKEGKLRIKSWPKLDYRDVQKTILKGQPILIWRAFRRERDDYHTDFAMRYDRDHSVELPDPKQDRQESSRWATLAFGAHSSLITGFNKARNEVLFTESWGESFRNRRMRQEEMEATVYGIFIFEY